MGPPDGDASPKVPRAERLFGTPQFRRLWFAQVVSALGDWLGFLAIAVLATQLGADGDTAIAVVMAARIVPGFFLAPVAGVLVDRWDRKRVMVSCDLGRAAVLATLPFVESLPALVAASLLLEVLTLLWAPAKEASVPHLVPQDRLTSANSLSLAAAYGTFPLASLLFTLLAAVSAALADVEVLSPLRFGREGSLAFYVDVLTFVIAAVLISTIDLPRRAAGQRENRGAPRLDWTQAARDLREGWHFIFLNPTVRVVNLGMGLALVGGGMLVPLGPVFSIEVLDAGQAGFGVLLTSLGFGAAAGIVAVNALQRRVPKTRGFTLLVFGAGASLFLAASLPTLPLVSAMVFVLGACAGAVYVLGFTLLHESVEDALRGRTFGALFTLVRFCVLVAFVLGPFLSAFFAGILERWSDGELELGGLTLTLSGVRVTLWLAGLIIVGAGFVAASSMRSGERRETRHPSRLLFEAEEAT